MKLHFKSAQQLVCKIKEKYPEKYKYFAAIHPEKRIIDNLANSAIGKFGFREKYIYLINDDKVVLYSIAISAENWFGKIYEGNICICFYFVGFYPSYIIFENLHNLTIEEFYRKIMS